MQVRGNFTTSLGTEKAASIPALSLLAHHQVHPCFLGSERVAVRASGYFQIMPRVPQFPNMKHLLRGAVLTAVSVDYSTGLQCRQCWVLVYGSPMLHVLMGLDSG